MTSSKPNSNTFVSGFGTWLIDRVNVFFRIRRYLKMIAQRWVIVFLCTVAGVSYSTYRAIHTPNVYRAASKLSIASKVETGFNTKVAYLEEMNNYYANQIEYMLSQAVLGKVTEKLRDYKSLTGTVPWADPKANKGSGATFVMTVESSEFEYAQRFATLWAKEFINFKTQLKEQAIGASATNTREEVRRKEKELDKVREKILQFQKEHEIGNVEGAGIAAQELLNRLVSEFTDIETQRKRLENYTAEDLVSVNLPATTKKEPEKIPLRTRPRPKPALRTRWRHFEIRTMARSSSSSERKRPNSIGLSKVG